MKYMGVSRWIHNPWYQCTHQCWVHQVNLVCPAGQNSRREVHRLIQTPQTDQPPMYSLQNKTYLLLLHLVWPKLPDLLQILTPQTAGQYIYWLKNPKTGSSTASNECWSSTGMTLMQCREKYFVPSRRGCFLRCLGGLLGWLEGGSWIFWYFGVVADYTRYGERDLLLLQWVHKCKWSEPLSISYLNNLILVGIIVTINY